MSKPTFRNFSQTYFFNACFDKNHLKSLISWFIKQSGEKITVDFLETLKQIGFHQATQAGISLGLDDLQIPSQKPLLISQAKSDVYFSEQQSRSGNLTSVEKSQQMISTWNQTSDNLRKTAVQQFKTTNPVNPVYMMAFSGARGNISQVRQLVAMRGLMADPQGVILEFPIQSNFREGLTLTEYLISCYGARKGLVDTALRTATSGYLTRRLVDAAQHVIVSIKDCGTSKGFRLRNKELEQHLIGRVLAKDLLIHQTIQVKRNQKISPTLAKLISKNVQEVFVRSPLTCEAENSICQLCYGWNLAHGNLVSIGEAVGVIAAQSIGEPGTQLTMRTFHTGGVGVFSDQAMKYFLAPYDGIIEYTEGLAGHFVRTPHGKIVYMLKNTTTTQSRILLLKSLETKEIKYCIKKQELPPGSILVVRQGERVKSGQVLAQSAHFKKSKQKMPESTHPVFSPLDGEIYIESMTILKQKQLAPKSKKVKKIQKKEIGPDIRTLKGLGSFWVFSSKNQEEFHSGKSILRAGDLVSSKSSLFQYDFYVGNRYIFQKILNKYCLGFNFITMPLEKINFHKVAYSMILKNNSIFTKQKQTNGKEFLFFNKKRLQNFLIWFPNGSYLQTSGYCFNFLLYSGLKNKKSATSYQLATKSKKIVSKWFQGNIFYITSNIKNIKNTSSLNFKSNSITYYLNLTNHKKFQQHTLLHYNPKLNSFSTNFSLKNNNSLFNTISQNKTKFLYYTQKNYLINFHANKKSDFLSLALKKAKNSILNNSTSSKSFVQKTKGWIYLSSTSQKSDTKFHNKQSLLNQRLLFKKQGKTFENFIFSNSVIGIKYIAKNKLKLLKNKKNSFLTKKKFCFDLSINTWYLRESFLVQDSFLHTKNNTSKSNNVHYQNKTNFSLGKRNYFKSFLYYKLSDIYCTKKINRPLLKIEKQNSQKQIQCFVFVSLVNEYTLPKKRELIKQLMGLKTLENPALINSPLFTKQSSTNSLFYEVNTNKKKQKLRKNFEIILSGTKGWFSSKNIFKLLINLNSPLYFKKVNQSYLLSNNLKNYKIPSLGLNLFVYNFISLPENSSFDFELFENQWLVPENKITTGFIKITKYGEFRRLITKKNKSIASILTTQDLLTLDFSKFNTSTADTKNFNKTKQIILGHTLRSGIEIFPGISSSAGGFILNKNFNQIIIRVGVPFLASTRGIIHVFQNDLIQKNDLLVTLKSRRLQTEDIVQGIPKIEQLFEARETQGGTIIRNSVHTRLKKYFLSSLKYENRGINNIHTTLEQAITTSFTKIQFYLVQSILQAYSSQGVKISQKHIEIIVRQMTSRVRILAGGDTGFLPGELIQFTRIKKLNHQLCSLDKHPALYEPIILGITKSVLQSESFLLSASFQEVSRVLVRSALSKKTDFLRGLHENVILGQLVPTGTGLVLNTSKIIKN
jgi:hypothetical protein